MKIINIVVINGEEVEVESLPNKDQLAHRLNVDALKEINYYEEKTA